MILMKMYLTTLKFNNIMNYYNIHSIKIEKKSVWRLGSPDECLAGRLFSISTIFLVRSALRI